MLSALRSPLSALRSPLSALVITLLATSTSIAQAPVIPPGGYVVCTINSATIQTGYPKTLFISGGFNVAAGTSFQQIKVEIIYTVGNNRLTQYLYSATNQPNWSMTIMNMPQTNAKFYIKAEIQGIVAGNPAKTAKYATLYKDANDNLITMQLYPDP